LLTILRYQWMLILFIGADPMNRIVAGLAVLAALVLLPVTARAQTSLGTVMAPPRPDDAPRCISAPDEANVSIGCTAVSEALGNQLAELMNRILVNRLDPRLVMLKLAEIEALPPEGVARGLSDEQRQMIVNRLAGKASQQIAITAHPQVADSADYARSLAAPLMMIGWQIEGNQVRRIAPKHLEDVYGIALVVQNPSAPPQKAVSLKGALSAANIPTPLVADPALPPEATLLWIGKRPSFGEVKQ
jgi:hypothetical protein